jgi:MraZ protein
MFRGRFEHAIDAKGRVSIPAKFRELLAEKNDERLIVTNNFDRCLVAYPYDEWRALEEKVASFPTTKKEVKSFQRFFISGAVECPVDKLGRILVPPTLRGYAEFSKNVVFLGMLQRFEIWSQERWLEEHRWTQEHLDEIQTAMAELGL